MNAHTIHTHSPRIARRFVALKEQGRTALVPFIMGYDPGPETTLRLLEGLPAAGADMIELGMPFSDPMADGPVIQRAGMRALRAGATLEGLLSLVRRFRESDTDTPLIVMGYYNPILQYGLERFAADAADAGVDGCLIVDLPPEEDTPLQQAIAGVPVDCIRLIAPTTPEERVVSLARHASGFLYFVSISGITGTHSASEDALAHHLARIRRQATLPVAAGFGIRTPEQARMAACYADAVVVGSAIVQALADAIEQEDNAPETATLEYVRTLRSAMDERQAA